MIRVCLVIMSLAFLAGETSATEAVSFELEVAQFDPETQSYHRLMVDTQTVVVGLPMVGFYTGSSVRLDLERADSTVDFTVHLITLGPIAQTYSRRFQSEYELPARISEIAGKDGSAVALSRADRGAKPGHRRP